MRDRLLFSTKVFSSLEQTHGVHNKQCCPFGFLTGTEVHTDAALMLMHKHTTKICVSGRRDCVWSHSLSIEKSLNIHDSEEEQVLCEGSNAGKLIKLWLIWGKNSLMFGGKRFHS